MGMRRREFIYTTAWGGTIAMAAPSLFAGQATAGAPVLVVIQLAGGNDGLNTVVPLGNDHYRRARPKIAIPDAAALRINDAIGLHPNLAGLKSLYDQGHLAIVEGVGYPNPNRSHFRSTEIWHTASDADRTERHGWLGRYFDAYCADQPASVGLCIGSQNPQAFDAATPKGVTFNDPRQLKVQKAKGADEQAMMQMMGVDDEGQSETAAGESIGNLAGSMAAQPAGLDPLAFLQNTATEASISSQQIDAILKRVKPQTEFPGSRLAKELQVVSQLIRGDMPTRVYYLSRGGFDTHTNQTGAHAALMKEWGDAMQAFLAEMKAAGQLDRVCVLVYSEFGRRVKENASGGTDHGVAAPVFVLGGKIKGGLHGRPPSLAPDDLVKGDIAHTTDYRSIYATLLEKHLGAASPPVLLREFPLLDIV